MTSDRMDLARLTLAERLYLGHQLLDDAIAELRAEPLTSTQIAELSADSDAMERGQIVGQPWEQVRGRLRARRT